MDSNDQRPVVILGAGRHGRNVLDVCLDLGRRVRGFLDDSIAPGTDVNGAPVLAGLDALDDLPALAGAVFFVALGDNAARRDVSARIEAAGGSFATLVHPASPVSASAEIGPGVFVNACCRVRANARLARGVLLESHSGVGGNASMGPFSATGPGVQMTADVEIGGGVFLGAGAIVTNRAAIGAGAVVGAGATVLADVEPETFVVGTPARAVACARPPDPHHHPGR